LDSITQAVLGATVATVCVPKQHRRKAVLVGGMLGTLPDLDVFIDYGDTEIVNDHLVISDLRMGFEGNYVFKHAVAKVDNAHIYEIPSKRLSSEFRSKGFQQIWHTLKQQL